MPLDLSQLQANRFLAYVVPLFLFLLLLAPLGFIEQDYSLAPWYRQFPEHWLYPLQTVLCGALLWFWRRQYQWGRVGAGAWFWGIVLGIVGIAFWILPCELWHRLGLEEQESAQWQFALPVLSDGPQAWWRYLGVAPREEGFDPATAPYPLWLALLLRFVRMVIIVALVEEIFWRGFLMRKLAEKAGDEWDQLPIGQGGWLVWAGSACLPMFAHQPVDWMAALIFFSLGYVLCVWQKSVWACVVMHAVANLILGIYAYFSGHYGMW